MMDAARSGLGARSETAGILAVTVLTSLDAPSLATLGLGNRPGRLVARLAKAAAAAGVEGIVCSARELGDVAQVAPGLVRVTPGIRPDGSTGDDQRRVATPEEAVERGADYLVVGRPITAAADPEKAAADLAIRLGIRAH